MMIPGLREFFFGIIATILLIWLIKKFGRKTIVDGAKEGIRLKNDLKEMWNENKSKKIEDKTL